MHPTLVGLLGSLAVGILLGAGGAHLSEEIEVQVRSQPMPSGEEITAELRERVQAGRASGRVSVAGVSLHSTESLPRFYEDRLFEPAWVGPQGLSEAGERLLGVLDTARADGLRMGDYHREVLDSLWTPGMGSPASAPTTAAEWAELELLLSDAFLLLALHRHQGKVDPETRRTQWTVSRPENQDMVTLLQEVMEGQEVESALESLGPQHPGYEAMGAALVELRAVAAEGGWGEVPSGGRLEEGSQGPRMTALRQRLQASGDLVALTPQEPELFDDELDEAVRAFQRRHGLDVDGVVGPQTLAALNVSVEDRIRQLEVNLERWRWLPQELGADHVLVNIADFRVDVVADHRRVMRLGAVVGRAYRQTPVMSDSITYLVLAPYWHVPPGIAVNDQLPQLRADPQGHLAAHNMTLLEQGTSRPVDPAVVDWASITGAEFNRRYRIRQEPGPWNALGQVKFMFPNRFNVYLHDTPAQDLFQRTARDFSSGCVRVERSLELAEHLLRDDPAWDGERIRRAAAGGVERTARLPAPVPVHLQYWTAWVDEEGVLHFRRDIYNRDGRVLTALNAPPPHASP